MDTVTTERTETEPTGVEEAVGPDAGTEALVEEELLVEEVSIDGMCGVY